MKLVDTPEVAAYSSPFLALSGIKAFPVLGWLGVESSGRKCIHTDHNLLKSMGGICPVNGKVTGWNTSAAAEYDADKIVWKNFKLGDKRLAMEVKFIDEHTFTLTMRARSGYLPSRFLQWDFAPRITPPSIWARPRNAGESSREIEPPKKTSIFEVENRGRDMTAPVAVYFPDYGMLQISADSEAVYSRIDYLPEPSAAGLTHGHANTGGHLERFAQHEGTVRLSFAVRGKAEAVTLTCTVAPETYPRVPGCNFNGPRWNGFRRNWMSAFALNPFDYSMGDNIILGGVAHLAIHYKSDMSLFTPEVFPGYSVNEVFRDVMERTFVDHQGPDGEINWQIDNGKKRNPGDYGRLDCTPSNMIALRNYCVSADDFEFARKMLPRLMKAAEFLAKFAGKDGILVLPFSGNSLDGHRISRNWWDDFPFGHKDGFINLLTYRAWGAAAEICERLEARKEAERLYQLRKKFAASFHKTFFNPKSGVYAGWISADGKMHDPMFTFISAMAINAGLVPLPQAKAIMRRMLRQYYRSGFEPRLGIPGMLRPLDTAAGETGTWAPMQAWGHYEHGGCCGQTAYHFLQALYHCGMRKEADKIFFAMLATFEEGPTHSGLHPGYAKSWDWLNKDGKPGGYNYLADNYYFLLAGITGHYGIRR